jgi:hypothetical protein
MHIASKMMVLRRELDQAHRGYHQGQADLSDLQRLDDQISALLAEARGTHFEHGLLCTQGLVRALHTRTQQKSRAVRLASVA